MGKLVLLLVLVSWSAVSASAARPSIQAPVQAPLERRANEVAAWIAKEPEIPTSMLAPAFLKAVPPAQLAPVCAELFAAHGPAQSITLRKRESEFSGNFDMLLEKDVVVPVALTVEPTAPFRVVGLWFGAPTPALKDFAALAAAFAKLPGTAAFTCAKLGDELEIVAEREGEQALAIGSAFKLYILGALIADVEGGKRKPEEIVRLELAKRSLPSGRLHAWPIGAPLTLHTLATAMISESDNTATDHLLFALGRERVESMLVPMGCAAAARNQPFLATREMFVLKGTRAGALANEYVALAPDKRRAFLAKTEFNLLAEADIEPSLLTKPAYVDTIEWFASTRDLCRAMDWIRRNTQSEKTRDLRAILAINPGLEGVREAFDWVGFKGGSESGVMNLTLLLGDAAGTWYALSATWNDNEQALDEQRFIGLVTRAGQLLAKGAR